MAMLAQFHTGRDQGHLFLIRPGEAQPAVATWSPQAVHEELIAFLQGAEDPAQPEPEAGAGLRALVEPIVRHAAEDEQVWIVPHGVLHFLPFHAVDTGEGCLGFRNPVCYTPSASTLRICRRGPRLDGRKPAVVLGDPTRDLRYARREARTVGDAFDSTPLLGTAATRDALLGAVNAAGELDLLHLACHGEPGAVHLAPDPTLGTEGDAQVLSSDDMLRRKIRAALVTVSACDSGLGRLEAADEVLGMTRALLFSGASSVLLSTWPVDDFSTYLFVERCYQELRAMAGAGSGSKAEAVRTAWRFVHGLNLAQVVELCDREAEACRGRGDTRGELDFLIEAAEYAARAGDLEEASRRYAQLAPRLAAQVGDDTWRKEQFAQRREEIEFQMVLKRDPVDYRQRPFQAPRHWASFFLHGDWTL